MSQNFIAQLEQVCRRRQRCRWLAATCWALVAVSVAAILLAGLDRALGIADFFGRTLLTSAFVAIGVVIARRWLHVLADKRVTPLQIAHEVERRHPQLRDVVSSAWDFGVQTGNDPSLGSESLRRAVVLQATTAVDDVDWQRLVPRQALRKSALALAGVFATIILLGWCLPQAMGIGLLRLVNPLSAADWPREHDLQFIESPVLLAAGEDLVLQLRDTRGALPATVTMHYRTRRQGRWHEERQWLTSTTDPLEIHRPNVMQSLQYRATGSDHRTMPWQPLEVVVPPHVETLQVTVHPPAYTQLPATTWDNNFPIYAGSDLELDGRTDQPVKQVSLRNKRGSQLAAQISADGHSFRIEPTAWRITENDTFTLLLTTASGLTACATTNLALEVIADQPPQVRFIEPTSDLTLLPSVAVPLVIEASDALAIREIGLAYRRSDRSDAGEQRLSLWQAPRDVKVDQVARQRRVEFLWQLAPLSLEPGCVVEVHAQARDAQPATTRTAAGQQANEQRANEQGAKGQETTGQTVRALRLNIVSEAQLWHQIVQQQGLVVDTLAQLLRSQRELRRTTAEWEETPVWSTERWASATHAALFRERQIASALAIGQHGVIEQLAQFSQTIQRNGLLRPEATDRLRSGQALLQNLVDAPLAAAEQSLSELARHAQLLTGRETLRPLLVETGEQQQQVVDGLRRVVDLLMPANLVGRLEGELAALEADQAALAKHCQDEVAPQLLQSELVTPAAQAALAGAVRRQRDLASRFAELMLKQTQIENRVADDEPTLAARLADTVAQAEELGLQATFQAAAEQLARHRLGRSASLQRQTIADLKKLLERLAGQDAEGAVERFERLQTAERTVQRLRHQVDALQQKIRKLKPEQRRGELARLRREREKLAEQTEELARQLQRLRTTQAAESLRKAASLLRSAKLDSKTTQQAQQQLDAAQRRLTTERRRQQVALARLQLAQLDAKLGAFVVRQQAIQQETVRLESLFEKSGQLSNAQQQSVLQFSNRQADLRDAVTDEANRLTLLPVFAHLLNMAGETMQRLENRLQKIELGQPAQDLTEQAVRQLAQLVEAVRQERQNLSKDDRGGGGNGGGEGKSGDTAQAQTLQLALGQLELLKLLQTGLREKTKALEMRHAAGQPSTNSAGELARQLAHQQRQLTELARQLVAEPPNPPAEEPFPNLEQELERSLDNTTLPRFSPENQP